MEPGHTFKKLPFGLLDLFLLFIAILQGSAQVLTLFFSAGNEPNSVLLRVWLSLGNDISENWKSVSVFLIIFVLGGLLFRSLKHTPSGRNLWTVGLLFCNLALCLRVYSNNSVSEKIEYLTAHLPEFIILSIIVLFVAAVILIMQKEYKNTQELETLFQDATNVSNDKTVPDGGAGNGGAQDALETAFRLKHPFSYAYRSFAKNLEEKRKIKFEYEKQKLQIKTKAEQKKKEAELENLQKSGRISESKGERFLGYISALFAFMTCAGIVVFLFSSSENDQGLQKLKNIATYIFDLTDALGDAQEPLTNFLLTSGVLFLFVILVLTLFLLIYISLRVVLYLLSHPMEDTARINRVGRAIKTFVFGLLDGALRPLLFVPSFLECLEKMLLDTDMDEKINEMYPPAAPPNQSTQTNHNGTPNQI